MATNLSQVNEDTVWHFGRSFSGTPLEDECSCPKAACGLVISNMPGAARSDRCPEHDYRAAKTIRQAHRAEDCKGVLPE